MAIRPRISLFTFLLLTTGLAIGLGVVSSRARKQKAAAELVKKLGGSVFYDYQVRQVGERITIPTQKRSNGSGLVISGGEIVVRDAKTSYVLNKLSPKPSPVSPWLSELIGDDFFVSVIAVHVNGSKLDDASARLLSGLPHLRVLRVNKTQISDRALANFSRMWRLEELDLDSTQIKGDGLRHLQGLSNLKKLNLSNTQVNDQSLKGLSAPKNLRVLNLESTSIGDQGLAYLQSAMQLETLNLSGTQVQGPGLKHLTHCPLVQLRLGYTAVESEGLEHLRAIPELRELWFEHSDLTDEGLRILESLTQLDSLQLPWVAHRTTNISVSAARRIEKKLPNTRVGYPP